MEVKLLTMIPHPFSIPVPVSSQGKSMLSADTKYSLEGPVQLHLRRCIYVYADPIAFIFMPWAHIAQEMNVEVDVFGLHPYLHIILWESVPKA